MGKQEELSLLLRLKDGVTKVLNDITNNAKSSFSALKDASLIFTGAFAGMVAGIVGSAKAFSDAQAVAAQTEKVLQSTGYAAGITAVEINKLAVALQNKTGIDDDVIQSGENMLLTFTNIGRDAFPMATKAAIDMTAAFNAGNVTQENLKGTMIQLGKALNDPTQGLTALRRVGVAFTEEQQEQIKALQQSGDLFGAQTMILKELQREFGGSSEKLDKMQGAFLMAKTQAGNFMEIVGEQLAPTLQRLGIFISNALVTLGEFVKVHKNVIIPVGAVVTIFTGLIAALSGIVFIAPAVAAAWVVITGPIGLITAAVTGLTAATIYLTTSQSNLAEKFRAVWEMMTGFATGNVAKMKEAYTELSESQAEHDANMAGLQQTAEDARIAFEEQKKQYDSMSADQRIRLITDALGKERMLKDLANIDELTKSGKHNQAKIALEKTHTDAFLKINQEKLKALDESWRKHWDAQVAMAIFGKQITEDQYSEMGNFFKNIMTVMGKESIAAFRIMQGVAIVNTLVATYESATKAFNSLVGIPFVGPILGGVAAGAAVAAGLANVDEIRRQQPPQAETGAYVKQGGYAELHDQEMVLNREQTAALANGGLGGQNIYLQIDGETLQKWVIASDKEAARMDRMGVR